jgi:hypothetical protein
MENHIYLSHGVQVTGAAWRAVTRIVAEVWDLVQRIGDGRIGRILSGRTIRRSGDVMCSLHRAWGDEEHLFFGWATKPRSTVCQWFGLKTTGTIGQWFGLKTGDDIFSRFGLKTGGGGFFSLSLKTGSYGLVILVSKSPRRFLGLCLKTKRTTVCKLRHKTDERNEDDVGTHRDLAACFAWKQVGLQFSSLSQNWWRRDGRWDTWHHCEGHVEIKLKTDKSMRWTVSDPATFILLFSMY